MTKLTVTILSLYLYLNTITSHPYQYLKFVDENSNEQRNNWQIKENEPSKSKNDIRAVLIRQTLDSIDRHKNNLNSFHLNKCKYDKVRNELNCVKDFTYNSKYERQGLHYYPEFNHPYPRKDLNDYDQYDGFLDLTRSHLDKDFKNHYNFSQDYLDINDLLRTNNTEKSTKVKDKTKKRIVYKIVPNKNKYDRFDFDLTRFRRINPKDFKTKKILRTVDKSESSDVSDSSEEKNSQNRYNIYGKRDDDDQSEEYSDEISSSDENTLKLQRNKAKLNKNDNSVILYMQGPSRMYKEYSRRRLPHFFPKRYHWDEDDIKDLQNYWFNGPQGKYSGHYRTPY